MEQGTGHRNNRLTSQPLLDSIPPHKLLSLSSSPSPPLWTPNHSALPLDIVLVSFCLPIGRGSRRWKATLRHSNGLARFPFGWFILVTSSLVIIDPYVRISDPGKACLYLSHAGIQHPASSHGVKSHDLTGTSWSANSARRLHIAFTSRSNGFHFTVRLDPNSREFLFENSKGRWKSTPWY